jgi:arabinogalactan endo-1,4-beta-galactosidase
MGGAGGTNPDGGPGTGGGNAGRGGNAGTSAGGGTGGNAGTTGRGGTTGMGGTAGGQTSLPFSYWLGVDISFPETQPVATRANLLSVLKAHGINSVRLRTFVDPTAADGYNKSGACDLAHTIDFGKQIKAAGMGFLVDFHYSDNWADPGKQCVPIKWQGYTNITQLATAVHDYTKDAITQLIAGGARPDMVQIGNETTPGMLIHRCDSGGSPTGNNPVTGSTSNWANLGALLKAGVDGVKEVDPAILTSFHIAKGGDHTDGKSALSTSVDWLTNALKYTSVDAFGESSYATYQGASGSASQSKMIWQTVEGGLAAKFPKIKFFAAEYGGFEREVNDVFYNLPNQAGLGTFFWEATTSNSSWNTGALVTQSGSTYTATSELVPEYDQMKMDYASRL